MENRSHALMAGVFILLLGIGSIAAVWWFGGQREATNTFTVITHRNVTGLSLQAQVRYRGIGVGKVESILLDPADARSTLIRINVSNAIPITKGTTAKLGYQGVTGIAHVLLEDNGKDETPLPLGPNGEKRIVMQDSLMQELTDAGGDTLRNARDLLANLNEVLSPENRQAIAKTLTNLETTSGNARATSEQLRVLLSPDNVQQLNRTLAHAEKTAAEAGPFFAEARVLVGRLQSVSEKLDTTLGDSSNGSVASLAPKIGALTTELSSSSHQLGRVLQMLEESPQSLLFGRQHIQPGPGESGYTSPVSVREQP